MLRSERIHDKFYIKEKTKVKESFKFLLNDIRKIKFNSLIDIGCANGSFLNFLNKVYKDKRLIGADVNEDLLVSAKKRNKNIEFFKLDISKKIKSKLKKKFDIVILSGVHTIYDDIEPLIKNASSLCKKKGHLFLFGSFNPKKFDVITRVREYKSKTWEKGFNRPSLFSTKNIFKKYFSFTNIKKFNFKLKIKESNNDPRRTHTVRLLSNKILTVNGLEQISTKYLILGKK